MDCRRIACNVHVGLVRGNTLRQTGGATPSTAVDLSAILKFPRSGGGSSSKVGVRESRGKDRQLASFDFEGSLRTIDFEKL